MRKKKTCNKGAKKEIKKGQKERKNEKREKKKTKESKRKRREKRRKERTKRREKKNYMDILRYWTCPRDSTRELFIETKIRYVNPTKKKQ